MLLELAVPCYNTLMRYSKFDLQRNILCYDSMLVNSVLTC